MEQSDDSDRQLVPLEPAPPAPPAPPAKAPHLTWPVRALLALIGLLLALAFVGMPVLLMLLRLPSNRPVDIVFTPEPGGMALHGQKLPQDGLNLPAQTRAPGQVLLVGPNGEIVTPEPTPRFSPTPDPKRMLYYRQTQAVSHLEVAKMNIETRNYPAAVVELNQVIEVRQDLPEAYYLRALCYWKMNESLRDMNEAFEYNQKGVADIDQAIRLEPNNGEYYYIRYRLYETLVNLYEYRADAEYLSKIALENLKIANRLGNADTLTPRYQVEKEFQLGECEQGFADWQKLDETLPADQRPSAGLHTILAEGLLICRADYAGALEHIDSAIQIKPSTDRTWMRTVILYHAGKKQEALEALNQSIQEKPNFSGYRYYLRALIHYELGDRAQAQADLLAGSSNTWGRGGMALYVQAHLALDKGDRKQGIQLLQEAEATMPGWIYTPLIGRFQKELAELGAEPLKRGANVPYQSTPVVLP